MKIVPKISLGELLKKEAKDRKKSLAPKKKKSTNSPIIKAPVKKIPGYNKFNVQKLIEKIKEDVTRSNIEKSFWCPRCNKPTGYFGIFTVPIPVGGLKCPNCDKILLYHIEKEENP